MLVKKSREMTCKSKKLPWRLGGKWAKTTGKNACPVD
jgi:hypothetical protein